MLLNGLVLIIVALVIFESIVHYFIFGTVNNIEYFLRIGGSGAGGKIQLHSTSLVKRSSSACVLQMIKLNFINALYSESSVL